MSHIVGLGQSNEQGAQSAPVLSGQALGYDALMFARGVQTRSPHDLPAAPQLRPPWDFFFWPLTAAPQGLWMGETPAMGMIAQLSRAYRALRDATVPGWSAEPAHFLYSYPHMGGKHLAELDWRDFERHPDNPFPGPGGYHATFVDDIRRAQTTAAAAGLSYEVLAFHFTQGENEGFGYLLPGGPFMGHSAFVSAYKADLANAYIRWDCDARTVTGRANPVPLFITQVDNCWAGQAQAELARECANVTLVGPLYYAPSALNSVWCGHLRGHRAHLSADGQRWRGEQAGKVMARVLLEGEAWTPLQPRSAQRACATTIVIRFDVPRPPLVFETGWLPKAPHYGFEAFVGTQDAPMARLPIEEVTITGADEVTINLLPFAGLDDVSVFVTYGTMPIIGTTSQPLESIRAGAPYASGLDAIELCFAGDLRGEFEPLLTEGCFILRQMMKSDACPTASLVIREVEYDGARTIARGEAQSLENVLATGEPCGIERDRPFGNLRDSDPVLSAFTFQDPSYGKRQGQPYPLHNFCVVFTIPVERNAIA